MGKSSPSASIELIDGTHVAPIVLMPGDPLRAQYVAEHYLENPVMFNKVRNMLGFTGTYKGKEISVMGSGMGIPSFILYAHELFTCFDVQGIIRIGSAGSLDGKECKLHDVVIAEGASTNSNIVNEYDLPDVHIAPVASYDMLASAVKNADNLGIHTSVGTVFSSDYFYNPDPDFSAKISRLGHLCVEMETAGLYMEARREHKKALSILSISDVVATGEALSANDRQNSFNDMMKIALDTAWDATK